MHPKCKLIFEKFEDVEFKNIPSYTTHLIDIFEKRNWNHVKMTKTNLQLAVLFNQLLNHTKLGDKEHEDFESMFASQDSKVYKECLRDLMEISHTAIIKNERKVIGKKVDGQYTYNGVVLNETICSKLDLFYVRKENFQHSVEPYHLSTVEFFAACFFAVNRNKWDELMDIKKDRMRIILPFISGLVSGNLFSEDFLTNIWDTIDDISADVFYKWLFEVNADRLPGSIHGWCWWAEKLAPSFEVLDMICQESHYPPVTTLPKTLVFIAERKKWKDLFGKKHVDKFYNIKDESYNLETFRNMYPDHDVVVRGLIFLDNNDDLMLFNRVLSVPNVKVSDDMKIYVGWVDSEDLLHVLPHISALIIGAQNVMMDSVMDVIAGNVPTMTGIRINNIQKYAVDNTHRVLDAALNVDVLSFNIWAPSSAQCIEIKRLLQLNPNYKNVSMRLESVRFGKDDYNNGNNDDEYGDRLKDVLSNMKCLEFYDCELDDHFFQLYGNQSINESDVDRFHKEHMKSFILHRYTLFDYTNTLVRYDDVRLNADNKSNLSVLSLRYTKVENVSPDILSIGLTNRPALCLCDVSLNNEQWEGLCDSIKNKSGVLREMRLRINKHIPWKHLTRLSQLPLLQIICDEPDDVIEVIRHFVTNMTNERRVRVIVGYQGLTTYWVEEEVYNVLLSALKTESNMQLLESKIKDEKYDDRNRTCCWACELSAPLNNDAFFNVSGINDLSFSFKAFILALLFILFGIQLSRNRFRSNFS